MEHLLRKMLGIIRYRGPDAFGMYLDRFAGLGSTRLSIIDLNTGDQPIHNEDESVWVVLNGEIFNYPELRQDLESKGHQFYTKSDTEVLVHLYEDHGANLFEFLNGQFALAVWDHRKETLLLGRDRVGIRPLFYYKNKGRLVFGSEIKELLLDDKIPRQIDSQVLSDIFTCWAPLGPYSVFKDIFQIPPGHFATFSNKGMEIKPYWELSFQDSDSWDRPLSDWAEELKDLLLDSAHIRLRADVPVGAYLSGGLDSAFITSLVKNNFNNHLQTFSVSFADDRFDESAFQEKAVEALHTDHKSIKITNNEIGKFFQNVIWHAEIPLLRTAPTPLFRLSKLVRDNNFKVVLTGEGADEIFAGYNIFKEDRIRRFWARFPTSKTRPKLLERLYPYIFEEGNGKTKLFLEKFFQKGMEETDSPAYSHMLRWENTSSLKKFFSNDFLEHAESVEDFIKRFASGLPNEFMSWDSISRAQYTEISIFLSNYLLSSQGDRMAMANSVEGRFPFLDHRVIEFASRIPCRFRLNGLKEKYILKKTAQNAIPQDLIERPKQPYRAPISRSFFNDSPPDYVEGMLSENSIGKNGYFEPKKVARLVAKCRKHDGKLLSERENMALVGILSTQLVHYQFIENFPMNPIQMPENVKVFKQKMN